MRFALHCHPIAIAVVACASLFAGGTAHAQSDADFVAAKASFERGDLRQLDALAPALSGHVLARYVEYWQLKSRPSRSSRAIPMDRSRTGCAPTG